MRSREKTIQLVSLCVGLGIIVASTLPDVLGYGSPGFSLPQVLGMLTGIFACSLGFAFRIVPAKVLLAVGVTLATATTACMVLEFGGVDTLRAARQAELHVEQKLTDSEQIGIFCSDSALGWKHSPGSVGRHHTLDFDVKYTIDADGCRAIPAPAQPAGTIHFLGCSYTFGQGVADDACYPAVLARKYWKTQKVKNHAVMGWGSTQALLTLTNLLGREDRPTLVIYGWISHHSIRNYRRKSQLLENEESGMKTPLFEIEHDHLVFKGLVGSESGWDKSETLRQAEIAVSIRLILEMNAMCRKRNIPFLVVSLPDPYALTEVNSTVLGAAQREGVVVFDASESREDYFKYDRHPMATWHADLARRLAEYPFIHALALK